MEEKVHNLPIMLGSHKEIIQQGHEIIQQGHEIITQGHEIIQQGHETIQQGHEIIQQSYESTQPGNTQHEKDPCNKVMHRLRGHEIGKQQHQDHPQYTHTIILILLLHLGSFLTVKDIASHNVQVPKWGTRFRILMNQPC